MKPFQDLHYFHKGIFAFVFISNSLIFERVEKIKYNQTCLVYLAILNPLFIGSRSVERSSFSSLSSSFSSAFFIFYHAAYDIVVLSKYWQYFQGYFFTKFCFNTVKNIFSKMTVKFLT